MSIENPQPDPEHEIILAELKADVFSAVKEGNPNLARGRCEQFGRGPEVNELRGLIELKTGNYQQSADNFNDAKLGYLHEHRYHEAAVASIKKSRAFMLKGEQPEAEQAVSDAAQYYEIYRSNADDGTMMFADFLRQQTEELQELDAELGLDSTEPSP